MLKWAREGRRKNHTLQVPQLHPQLEEQAPSWVQHAQGAILTVMMEGSRKVLCLMSGEAGMWIRVLDRMF